MPYINVRVLLQAYRHIHSIHHEFDYSISWVTLYKHPVEYTMEGMIHSGLWAASLWGRVLGRCVFRSRNRNVAVYYELLSVVNASFCVGWWIWSNGNFTRSISSRQRPHPHHLSVDIFASTRRCRSPLWIRLSLSTKSFFAFLRRLSSSWLSPFVLSCELFLRIHMVGSVRVLKNPFRLKFVTWSGEKNGGKGGVWCARKSIINSFSVDDI